MIERKIIYLIILFIFSISSQANDKITLYLDWLNQFQFAGYYVAKEKGYYNNLELDVDIKEFTYNSNIIKDVMDNESTYGIGKSSLIIDKFNNNDMILLSSIFQKSPMVLISLHDSNIKTPKDLKNKNIMITDDAISSAAINSMIISQGVKLTDITTQKHSFDINDLINKKTDAMACFLSNEPYTLKKQNIQYDILNPNEYNFDFYEGILYTSQKELLKNPNRVYNFNKASLEGWNYAFNHIEETAKLIYDKYNTQNKSLDALIYEGNILKSLSKIDEGILGKIDTARINEIKRFYSFLGLNKLNTSFDTNSIILNKTNIVLNSNQIKYLEEHNFNLIIENNENTPLSFKLNGKLNGIEIDIWNLISNNLSKPFTKTELVQDEISNVFLSSINANFIYSFEKKHNKGYLSSESITQIPLALITTNNKNIITDLSSLKNIKIGVIKDEKLITTLKERYPDISFISIDSLEQNISKLERNELFALIDNMYTASHKINKKFTSLKINSFIGEKLNLYLQVEEKNSEFINILNTTINRLKKEDINTILNTYQFIFYPTQIDYYLILKIVFPFMSVIAFFIYFNIKLKKEILKRKEIELQLSEFANKDTLTNIFNRRKIEDICEIELIRVKRYGKNLSILFFDINDFKYVNDTFGHHVGDEVLIKISKLLSQNIRETDSIGRWGGDEFLIILPETSSFQCKHIIFDFEEDLKTIEFSEPIKVTCSFGVATYEDNDDLDSLLRKADESMYHKKSSHKKIKN